MIIGFGISVSPENINGLVKVLAVLGGAVLGGLIVGLLAQLLSRALTTRKLPRWPMFITRLLGAVVGGWLVALWVFGGGGGGIGGPGGWGFGSGTGRGTQQTNNTPDKKAPPEKQPSASFPEVSADSLRVEVLSDEAIRRSLGKDRFDPERAYRIPGKDGPRLLTLSQLEQAIKERVQKGPPLRRLDIVLYKDSPSRDNKDYVTPLVEWARDLPVGGGETLKVDFFKPEKEAPTE